MKKVLLGISGGVDSSVAAFLLKNKGFDVTGVTLDMFSPHSLVQPELYHDACADAQNSAETIGIDFIRLDVKAHFKKFVTDDFINQYLNGATPNPCVMCNIYIKFGIMLDFALEHGFDYIATGHYAKIEQNNGRYLLKIPDVREKEQTYVLWGLNQHQLSHTLFPLAEFSKTQIREIADSINLPCSKKKDSQDICFVPDKEYVDFIEKHSPCAIKCGNFIDENGHILGTHKGIANYTLGQRKGLGIALGKPAFVVEKNAKNNTVTLSDEDRLFVNRFTICKANWIMFENAPDTFGAFVKTRYSQKMTSCIVNRIDDTTFSVESCEKIRAVTPGQSAVFYDENGYVLGGGIIMDKYTA